MFTGRITAVAAALTAAAGITLVGGTASAATSHQAATPQLEKTVVGLSVTGFDANVAKAHGYQVAEKGVGSYVVTKNGKSHTITTTAAARGGAIARPFDIQQNWNTAYGNCGESWIGYYATGNRTADVYSGYQIYYTMAQPVGYDWDISVADGAGVGSKEFYDGTSSYGWSIDPYWTTHHSVSGYSYDTITYGYVSLDDGSLCSSAHIQAYDYLY